MAVGGIEYSCPAWLTRARALTTTAYFGSHYAKSRTSRLCGMPSSRDRSQAPSRSNRGRRGGRRPRQSPGLGYKRVVSCKDSFHGTDALAVSEHGAPGRRPNIHAHFVGRQREDGLAAPPRQTEALSSRTSRSRPLET